MFIFMRKLSTNILVGSAVMTMAVMPVVSWADASAPGINRIHKAKPKMRKRMVKPRIVRAAKPAPVEVVQEAAPPEAPPVPEAPPAPVVAEAPAPPPMEAPAPPAAPLAVAKKGGKGILIGLIGAAAVVAGVIIAADSNKSSNSP
jgi:hypothetical protein